MSLFPAYSDEVNKQSNDEVNKQSNENEESKKKHEAPEWLTNSSYQQISAHLHSSTENEVWPDSSDEDMLSTPSVENEDEKPSIEENYKSKTSEINSRQNRKYSKEKRKKSYLAHYKTEVKDIYFEDKDRNKIFCTIETLEYAMRPSYKLSEHKLGSYPKSQFKVHHFRRYHVTNLDKPKKLKKNVTVESNTEENIEIVDKTKDLRLQEQRMIEEFNKKLAESPNDINLWLEYINFQDKVAYQSSFCYEKENLKNLVNQKKLSIVEKCLTLNRDSIELLNMKLDLMSRLSPADQFSNQIEVMIQKDSRNIILWQVLIKTVQSSCALCKVSNILNLYVKCFSILKKNSRGDPKFYDEQILGLLYQCLIFLRHAGLWEQMWEILRINLCLNLALPHETLRNVNTIDEKNLMNMEELILASKLPLNQLWLRIESLRESFHWTSVDVTKTDVNIIGDEKRLVSAEETTDFIYPTISRESNFRLVVLSLLCLKVPLLPTRHCTLKDFNLEEHLWCIDSLEFILPMIYPTIWTGDLDNRLANETVIKDLLEGKLTSGPQFLKFHPAQELFLDFIRSVFNTVAEKLPSSQRTSIFIWWLRFERLLIFITKNDPLNEKNRNKKVKSIIKNFLKKPENRNNLHFYREFALIERELGAFDNSIQMLKTIIHSQNIKLLDIEEKAALFSQYRTIFEMLLDSHIHKDLNLKIFQEMVESLKNYVSLCFNYDCNMSIEEMLYNEILKFLMNPATDESEDTFLLPNIYCDIVTCYAYLMHSKSDKIVNIDDILNLFDRCLTHCNKCFRLQERFYETKVAFLQFCQNRTRKMNSFFSNSLQEALKEFPSNFFFLSVNGLIESEQPYWKIQTNSKTLNIWSIFANCLAVRARITYLESIGSEYAYKAMINKMISFHKVVSKTLCCPLIWRFYMLLLREHDLCEKKGEEIYYEAVSQCPWSRSVYISAAEIAPQILSQIQDLIKEKELRIHVTPEELEILRG